MRILHINDRFVKTLRKQNAKEQEIFAKHLEAGILPTPIVFWHNPENDLDEIVDGHHRYEYAQEHGLEFETFEMHFANESQAEAWIIYHQFSQRNVDDWAVSKYLSQAVQLERDSNPAITKREAVSRTAESAGVSERTVWRAEAEEKPKNPVEVFKEAKAQLDQVLTREKNKAVAEFKKEVIKDELDEDAAADQWQTIEAGINERHQDKIDEVETLGMAAQQAVEENPGLKNAGKKRPHKKSTRDRAAKTNTLKKAKALVTKLQNEVLYFWEQTVGTINIVVLGRELGQFMNEIEAEMARDAKKKGKFGKK